jgi:hypothetical protein
MILVSMLVFMAAAYLFWSPIEVRQNQGFPIDCGSAAAPPTDDLGQALCRVAVNSRAWQAATAVAMAMVIAGGGIYVFGVSRTRETDEDDADAAAEDQSTSAAS